jgi:CRP-like cAMP-binding protein
LRAVLDRYLAMLLGLSAQLAGCSHFHTLPSRVARLLMLAAERSSGEVHLSHEVIARVLGAQRPSVSLTLERMRDEGLLSYRRADIRIQDAAGLRALSCACYVRFRQSLDTLRTALARHSR